MVENWERGLANSSGDIVMFVGDDDGLLADACEVAAAVLEDDDAEILSWAPFLYLWPGYWDLPRRNVLQATVSYEFVVRASRRAPCSNGSTDSRRTTRSCRWSTTRSSSDR